MNKLYESGKVDKMSSTKYLKKLLISLHINSKTV